MPRNKKLLGLKNIEDVRKELEKIGKKFEKNKKVMPFESFCSLGGKMLHSPRTYISIKTGNNVDYSHNDNFNNNYNNNYKDDDKHNNGNHNFNDDDYNSNSISTGRQTAHTDSFLGTSRMLGSYKSSRQINSGSFLISSNRNNPQTNSRVNSLMAFRKNQSLGNENNLGIGGRK